jgi:hypothetical protein
LNRRHADFQSAALPTELPGLNNFTSDEFYHCVEFCGNTKLFLPFLPRS